MSRALIPFLAFALLAPAVLSAPKVKERPAVDYFPTEVGAKRVYKFGDLEQIEIVTPVAHKDGRTFVTVEEQSDPKAHPLATTYRMSEEGLVKVTTGDERDDPPECRLRLPVSAKATWEAAARIIRKGQVTTYRGRSWVVGKETVEVPAGTFRAVRVDTEIAFEDAKPSRWSQWYAPGVGLVRMASEDKETSALKSFTPAPATKK